MADAAVVDRPAGTLRSEEEDPGALLIRAREGDGAAWDALVDRFTPLLWAVARNQGTSRADAADAIQTTWLRLLQHADRISDPQRIAGWLGTTMRRECWRLRRRGGREMPAEVEVVDSDPSTPEDAVVTADSDERVRAAIAALPPRYRVILEVLTVEPAPSYAEAAEILGLPIGSIGPMRGRALKLLRANPLIAELA